MRGFRFRSSLKKSDPNPNPFFLAASQLVSSAFGRRRVDEAPRRKREKKTSGTQCNFFFIPYKTWRTVFIRKKKLAGLEG